MSVELHSPYKLTWLDSCQQETLLPGSPWIKVRDALNDRLAAKVRTFCRSSEKNTIKFLLELLGKQFVATYLSDVAYPKQDNADLAYTSETHYMEVQAWLHKTLQEITSSLGFNWKEGGDPSAASVSRDMLEFVGFTQQVVFRGMERELAAVERKQNKSLEKSSARKQLDILGGSYQSDTIGTAVSALLSHHPSQLSRVCEQLYGRQLPNSLRQLIWSMRLQKASSDIADFPKDFDNQLGKVRVQFESSISWGLKELGLASATKSPIEGVLKHAVTEAYKYRPGLQHELVSEVHMKQAVKVLNVLYVHNRSYEPHYALLVYPLIFAFQHEHLKSNELSHKLALLFHLLQKNCFPTRLQIFSMADHVIERLSREDKQLYDHLVSSLQKNISFDAREFLVNFIHTEKEKALLQEREETGQSFESIPSDAKLLLSHPIMFIRKWIVEGFVGILGVHAVMLVWDQCFMSNWKPSVMENTCLVILQLLRDRILEAGDYPEIRRVLLDRPSELYCIDIQQGLSYLGNGGALQDVGSLRQPTQLPSLSESEGIIHSSTPSAQSHSASMSRPPSRRSAPSTSPHSDPDELWVERSLALPSAELTTHRDPFDLYIEEVRFIPDNATIIKVTGRILGPFWQKPDLLDIPDIEAIPLFDSSARCPKFSYRYTVNIPAEGLNREAMLLLRTYTVDVNSGELIVIGNSILRLFNEEGEECHLNAGGHQLPLKHVLPSTVSKLTEQAFDDIVKVPVCSVLIRLLPHSEDFVESPSFSSGYYSSDACKPNQSEWRIFCRYQKFDAYPPTVREAVRDISDGETREEGFDPTSDQAVSQFYSRRTSKHILKRQPAKPTDLTKVVQYDQKQGLSFTVEQAHGLPSTNFVNVFVHVLPGPKALELGVTEEGSGGEEKLLIKQRNFDSYQKAPKWIDTPTVLHPSIDEISSLVIRLYSLDAVYSPRADHTGPGPVVPRKGRSLVLEPVGWTVLQLFSKEYVNAGIHHLPLFDGTPSSNFIEFLSSHPVDVATREAINQDIHTLMGTSSVTVRLWDAHYSLEECVPLPLKDESLSLGKAERYKKMMQTTSGKLISDIVLQTLTRQERKQGVTGERYRAEKDFYEEAMNTVFINLMDDVLLESGLGPFM